MIVMLNLYLKLGKKRKMKDKMSEIFMRGLLICYFCFSVYWSIVLAHYNYFKFGIYVGEIILVFSLIYFILKKVKMVVNKKVLIVIFIILALVLRLALLILTFAEPVSDYATFYYNAVTIATGEGVIDTKYISAFPYLYGYILLLGLFMKLFGIAYVNVVILNIILDLIGAIFMYLFTNNFNKKTSIYALFLWLFNPFGIYFSIICSPVILVNVLIAIVLYVSSIFFNNLDNKKNVIFYGILLGSVLAIVNIFRPIMIIFIIACLLYLLYLFIDDNLIKKVNLIIGFLLILSVYQVGNQLYFKLVSDVTAYDISKSMSGWSIYVGSNYDAIGEWSPLNIETYNKYYNSDNYTPQSFNDAMMSLGIDRYKDNGIKANFVLFAKKSSILVARTNDYNYNSFTNYNTNDIKLLDDFIRKFTDLFWYLIIVLNFIFAIIFWRLKRDNFKQLIPYCLFVIGFFMASLIVEVSPRYFYPLFTVLIFLSAVALYNLIEFFKKES